MGVRYSATDSALLIQALTNNITTANQVSDRLASGCDHLMSALDSGELQGAAYTAGRGLFSDIMIPSIQKLQEAIDDIQAELTSYIAADGVVSEFGSLDLDQLKRIKELKYQQLENVEKQIKENNDFFRQAKALFSGNLGNLWQETNALYEIQHQLEIGIKEIEDKIDKLEWFVAQVSRYFTDSLSVLNLAIKGASQLSQVIVDSNGGYSVQGLDMSWVEQMKNEKIETFSDHDYNDSKAKTIGDAARNMMLSDEGEAFYRKQLKAKLEGKHPWEWQTIIDEFNHSLLIDKEGNIIEITDKAPALGPYYIIKKNGELDEDYTLQVNKKLVDLRNKNFDENSAEFLLGVVKIISGLGIAIITSGGGLVGLFASASTGGASAVVTASAVPAAYAIAGATTYEGVAEVSGALSKIGQANGQLNLSRSSNYEAWQSNKPTSKTIDRKRPIEANYGGKKIKIRVDAEPRSGLNSKGKLQVQSGSGKSGYDLDEGIDMESISNKQDIINWVNKNKRLRSLSRTVKKTIIERLWKGYNWILK